MKAMSVSRPSLARNIRVMAALTLIIGWIASCGPGGTGGTSGTDGTTIDAFGRKILAPPSKNHYSSLDPAWGVINLPSPSPGDANPLRVNKDGPDLVYTFVPAPGASVQTVTYISQRTTGQAAATGAALPVDPHASPPSDTVQQESSASENRFEVRVGYQHFYHGEYRLYAFVNRGQDASGSLDFSVN
jgi:hypothetical protein